VFDDKLRLLQKERKEQNFECFDLVWVIGRDRVSFLQPDCSFFIMRIDFKNHPSTRGIANAVMPILWAFVENYMGKKKDNRSSDEEITNLRCPISLGKLVKPQNGCEASERHGNCKVLLLGWLWCHHGFKIDDKKCIQNVIGSKTKA